jgi:hypothetical protein
MRGSAGWQTIRHPRRESRQGDGAVRVRRDGLQLLLRDDGARNGRRRIEERSHCIDHHGFAHRTDVERRINILLICHLEFDG